jgi:LacI family transcriptional regulator
MLTARILAAGHRRVGFLTLREGMEATTLRLAGYRDALAAAGVAWDPALVRACDFDRDDTAVQVLFDAIDAMLRLPEPPTVLLCGNDKMALRVYGLLRSRGVRVPDDLSVAGYDNHRVIAETLYPALTTAELPYAAIGVRAAERLLALIAGTGGAEPAPTLVCGPVHWRASVTERPARVHRLRSVREE